jgi:predicted ATPase/class 3 adenylate cyclase
VRETVSVEEAAVILGIGLSLAYELADGGEIPTIRWEETRDGEKIADFMLGVFRDKSASRRDRMEAADWLTDGPRVVRPRRSARKWRFPPASPSLNSPTSSDRPCSRAWRREGSSSRRASRRSAGRVNEHRATPLKSGAPAGPFMRLVCAGALCSPVQRELPAGTVTFLFTDVEGSTKLLHELGAEAYADVLAEHRRVLRGAFAAHGGVEVDTQGDAFFVVFPSAPGALEAAAEAKKSLASGPIRARMGIHTGTPHLGSDGYVGADVHLGARIAASGHGGQILVSQATRALVPVKLEDLGEHRLKDFAEPVGIFQLGSEHFPPLRTISNTNLPRPASSFVGREREVAEVTALFEDGARLVTLSGPGGSGKTRLAIEAASELVPDFKHGTFWVGLAALRDPALVPETIAQTLGAKDGLAEHIGERELMLLLDNLEQVVEAAPELASLVEACPNLRLIVTSRERLRIRGEVEYPVLPLAELEAVELFCQRGRAEREEAVHDLCRALDNLPLALELAAARASALSPRQILERLSERLDLLKGGRDADPRQQTLRATIEWSYELLSREEQQLFARLGVFAGGCTLEAAEQVADAELDTLQLLVDKSLLRHSQERFWMLETIREYAAERLHASRDAEEVGRRNAEHFLALAEQAEPHLFGASPGEWLDRLERELDNLRTALDWLEASAETELALRMAGALAEFWAVKGHLTEGRRRIEHALGADERPTAARAKALNGAADLANGSGDIATARLRAEEGLALNRTLGRAWGTADSLLLLGIASNGEGDFVRARELIDESVCLFRDLGDERNTLEATRFLAWTYRELGDLDQARALLERNVRQAHALGDKQIEARCLDMLAGYALDEGRVQDALRMLKEAYGLNRELGDVYWTPIIVCRLGRALAASGRARLAARVLSSGEALLEDIGAGSPWIARMNEETLAVIRTQLDEAAFAEVWEQGRTLGAGEAVALALDSLGEHAGTTAGSRSRGG